jgi:hypothetical protein
MGMWVSTIRLSHQANTTPRPDRPSARKAVPPAALVAAERFLPQRDRENCGELPSERKMGVGHWAATMGMWVSTIHPSPPFAHPTRPTQVPRSDRPSSREAVPPAASVAVERFLPQGDWENCGELPSEGKMGVCHFPPEGKMGVHHWAIHHSKGKWVSAIGPRLPLGFGIWGRSFAPSPGGMTEQSCWGLTLSGRRGACLGDRPRIRAVRKSSSEKGGRSVQDSCLRRPPRLLTSTAHEQKEANAARFAASRSPSLRLEGQPPSLGVRYAGPDAVHQTPKFLLATGRIPNIGNHCLIIKESLVSLLRIPTPSSGFSPRQ